MADCKHQIDLCPDCDGLQTVRLDRLPGVTNITVHGLDGLPISSGTPSSVYVGQVPGPCPNPKEVTGRG
ncbi:hypothetical protein ACFPN0_15215 [Kitasatospora cinereorecta]